MGKPMGNGHPISAVVTTREIADKFASQGVAYFNTFGGNNVSCAISLAVLDVLERERLVDNARIVGDHLVDRLGILRCHHDAIGDVRGVGLFVGLDLVKDRQTREPDPRLAEQLKYRLLSDRILVSTDGPHENVIKFKPPMCFTRADVDFVCHRIDHHLGEMRSGASAKLCLPVARTTCSSPPHRITAKIVAGVAALAALAFITRRILVSA